MEDARLAVSTGVDGLDLVIGTSSFLREHSHGKDMDAIIKAAIEVVTYVKDQGLEVRFSSEDSFRSDLVDLLTLYRAVDKVGVHRQVPYVLSVCEDASRRACDIETHFHNDTGCAIANAYTALEAGATHVDTSVLGLGERNGITPLGGFLARMIVADRDYCIKKYRLAMIKEIEDFVSDAVEVNTPFNILNNPQTYEILNPADFGLTRYVHFASRLTGWNAVKTRVGQLGLSMTDDQVKTVTAKIKTLADIRPIAIDDADSIIRSFHLTIQNGEEAGETNKFSGYSGTNGTSATNGSGPTNGDIALNDMDQAMGAMGLNGTGGKNDPSADKGHGETNRVGEAKAGGETSANTTDGVMGP
ncbi:MAG: hypothetical protein LQ340_003905 [Diploschistes diacapsis]|nr:MAG: hypothetical protein LQ340_003905 [Diploschistes diacapsis]